MNGHVCKRQPVCPLSPGEQLYGFCFISTFHITRVCVVRRSYPWTLVEKILGIIDSKTQNSLDYSTTIFNSQTNNWSWGFWHNSVTKCVDPSALWCLTCSSDQAVLEVKLWLLSTWWTMVPISPQNLFYSFILQNPREMEVLAPALWHPLCCWPCLMTATVGHILWLPSKTVHPNEPLFLFQNPLANPKVQLPSPIRKWMV